MDARFKQLKGKIGKIEATDTDLKGKIATIEATDVALQGKIDTKYTELEGKIDGGQAELKRNLSYAIPDYNTIVEGKYMSQNIYIIFGVVLLMLVFDVSSLGHLSYC